MLVAYLVIVLFVDCCKVSVDEEVDNMFVVVKGDSKPAVEEEEDIVVVVDFDLNIKI